MLPLNDTQRFYVSVVIVVVSRRMQVIVHRLGITVPRLFILNRVTTKRVAVLRNKLQFFCLVRAVHFFDVIKRHPLGLENFVPSLGVIVLSVWI